MITTDVVLALIAVLALILVAGASLTYTSPVAGSVYNGASSPVIIPVGQWELNPTGRAADVTQTDAGGGAAYRGFVQDPEWSFTLFLDDASFAIATTYAFGTQIASLAFKYGGGSKVSIVANTMSMGARIALNANGDPISVTVSGKGGTVTHNANVPS